MMRNTDDEAKEILQGMGLTSGTVVQTFSRKERDSAIGKMLREGLSIRQIERLTGISRGIIQKIKR